MATDDAEQSQPILKLRNNAVGYVTSLDIFSAIRAGFLLITSLLWLVPLLSLIYVASQPTSGLLSGSFWAIPDRFALFENIMMAWTQADFRNYAINSLLYASLGSVIAVFLASLAGFTLARLNVPFKDGLLFLILLFTFFPFQMYLIPLVKMSNLTGLYNTKTGLSIVYATVAIPFAAFVLRNYFVTIPTSLYEAARIDGLSKFQIYWRIYLPLAKPALAVAVIFQWIWIWNEFVFGLVLTSSPSARPVATALGLLGGRSGSWTILAAGALLTVIPPLVVFLLFQKHFVRGLLSGTQKG